jgi:trigger factor
MGAIKSVRAQLALRSQAIEALVELVTEDPPEALVQAELERRVQDLGQRLEAQKATIAQYLEATGQTEEQLLNELREAATQAVKADLGLRSVADSEDIEASDDEVEADIARLAERFGRKPAQLRRDLERNDQISAIRSDSRKNKALEWIIDHVEVVDEEGQPIDRALLSPESEGSAPATPEDLTASAVETRET